MKKAEVKSEKKKYEDFIKERMELKNLLLREQELRKKILKVQLQHPRALRPNLEFEDTDEYVELKKEEYQLTFDKNDREIRMLLKQHDDKISEYEKIINEL